MNTKSVKSLNVFAVTTMFMLAAAAANAQTTFSNALMSLSPGPVAYWPLQENTQPPAPYVETNLGSLGAVGNAYYASTNVQGQYQLGQLIDGGFTFSGINGDGGAVGVDFNGSFFQSFMAVPTTDSRVSLPAGKPFTVEAWIYPCIQAQKCSIISQTGPSGVPGLGQTTNAAGWSLNINYMPRWGTTGQNLNNLLGFSFHVFNGVGNLGLNSGAEADAANYFNSNFWYHVVGVFDGTNCTLYVDGTNNTVYQQPINGSFAPDTWDPLMFGVSHALDSSGGASTTPTAYTGGMLDVAIYTNALTFNQVSNDYAYGIQNNVSGSYTNWVMTQNKPYLFWQLSAPSYTVPLTNTYPIAANYGSDNDPNINGLYQPGTIPGAVGPSYPGMGSFTNAVAINGLNAGVMSWTNGNSLSSPLNQINKPLSLLFWFKGNPADTEQRFQGLVSHGSTAWHMSIDTTGHLHWTANGSPDLVSVGSYNDGNWHFVGGVYTNAGTTATGTNYIYVDGRLDTSVTNLSSQGTSITNNGIILGGDPSFVVTNLGVFDPPVNFNPLERYFAGSIAHVAYFANALTAAQIQNLYTNAVPTQAPYIILQPTTGRTITGAAPNFSFIFFGVVANGSPTLAYQWYYNSTSNYAGATQLTDGNKYQGSQTFNVAVSNLVNGDAGFYYVVITNNYGSVTSSIASLVVDSSPVVTSQIPSSAFSMFTNQVATLSVTATGETPLAYQWFTNGVADKTAGTNPTYSVVGSLTANSETYYCQVTNISGLTNSATVTETLMTLPPSLVNNTYSSNVLAFGATGYWPLHEHESQPLLGVGNIETNYGTWGSIGNGYYQDWASPGIVGHRSRSAIAGDTNPATTFYSGEGSEGLVVPHWTSQLTLGSNQAPFAMEAWVEPFSDNISGVGSYMVIMGQGGGQAYNNSANHAGFDLQYGGSPSTFSLVVWNGSAGGSFEQKTSPSYPPGSWYHIFCYWSGSNEAYFVNGQVASVQNPNAFDNPQILNPDIVSPFTVGGGRWGGNNGLNQPFNGSIDEVAYYTNVTSQLQAQNIAQRDYLAGTTVSSNYFQTIISNQPVLYYRMDAPGYTQPAPGAITCVLTNYGTVAQNGVYVPSAVPGSAAGPSANGIIASGFMDTNAFQGNSVMSFMDAGFNPLWNPVTTNAFSFSIWCKGQPVDDRSFGSQMLSDNDSTVRGSINSGGNFQIHGNVDVIPGNNVNDGNWHHMVMCVQPGYTNGVFFGFTNYLYIDGVLAKSQAAAGTNNPFGNANGVETLIGDEWGDTNPVTQGAGGRSFFGALSEAAFFYGTVLTSNQVVALYSSGALPPSILSSPVSGNATALLPYSLGVTASGASPLYYQWYTNGVAIGGNAETNFNGQITNGVFSDPLVINPVLPNYAGTYYAVVSNSFGMATSAVATVTVLYAPGITNYTPIAYTNPFSLYAGVTPIFSVSAIGAPNLGYYWYTNGAQDASVANTSFTYTNYNVQAAFTNFCIVSNTYGMVTSIVWAANIIPDPTAAYPQWVLSNSPAAYWRLNETNPAGGLPDGGPDNGVVANDYAGGNDGLYTNVTLGNIGYSPTLDPSDFSASFGSSPANSDVCAINGPDFTTPNGNNAQFTVSAWVYPNAAENGNAGIVAKGLFNQEEYNLDCGGGNAGFRFEVRQSGSQNVSAGGSIPLGTGATTNLNKWYQLVGVVDQANSTVSFYINGLLNATAIITNGTGLFNSAATPLSIGSRSSINPSYVFGGDDQQFFGYVTDVAIYRHTLSSNMVLDSYVRSVGVPPFLISKLIATNYISAGSTLVVSNNPTLVAGSPGITNWWTLLSGGSPISNIVMNVTSTNATLLNASLIVSNVPQAWNGDQLELSVSNAFGGTNYIANLIVSTAPVIVQDIPPALTLVAGRYYTYSPTLIGFQPITFQWYSNNVVLTNQINPTYSFTAKGSGIQNYQYIATNIFGAVTSGVSSVTVASSYQSLILSNGPAAYWPLDEHPDDGAGDDTNYAQDLASTNTMQYTNSVIGVSGFPGDPFTVAQFGTFAPNTSFAHELGQTANPDMGALAIGNGNNGEFSVECWVNGPPGQALNSRIVDCGYFFHEEWALDLGTTTPASAFRFTVRGANETEYDARASIQPDNNWHYLVGVCDGVNGQLVLYIDGQVAATNNFDLGFGPGVGIDERPEVIAIGAGDNSSTESGQYNAQWTGKISDVAIYTNALTPAQILAHYQSVTAGIYPIPVVTNQLPVPGENQFTLYAGVSPTYQAIASGVAPLFYQWYSNGVAVASATNTTFTINKVQSGGLYTNYCVITNAEGAGTSVVWNASVISDPTSLFPATVLSNNPIAYWRLNESSGTIANDYAGGANGTYGFSTLMGQVGIPYGAGELGVTMNNAAPGVAAGCVSSAGVILNTNTITLLCWINASTLIETNPSGLIFTRLGNNIAGDQIGSANDLDYTWSNNPSTYNYGSGLQVPANKWTLVALTTTPTNSILYVINTNGFNSATNPVANLTQSFEGGVYIGADPLATNRIFQGEMDEAAMFNYTLSATQLQQLFSAATNSLFVVNTSPTNITFSVSGNKLTLSWPFDHTGWLLQSQTNSVRVGITTNWANVTGSTATNAVVVPVNLTNGCVFYRLVYP